MTLRKDLLYDVRGFATDNWGDVPKGNVVPAPEDLTHGNTGKRVDVTVLYADLHRSTQMVEELPDTLAAEYYKAFLRCGAKIVRANGGTIQAYDGDRIMAIFIGQNQADSAVTTALQINWAVQNVINATFSALKGLAHRPLLHTVGVDCGRILVAKTGVRIDSDLVWVGGAANYAAKLNSFDGLDTNFPTRISTRVMDALSLFYKIARGNPVWEGPFTNVTNCSHYRTSFSQTFD